VITLALGAEISATRRTVWSALVDPGQVMRWRRERSAVLEALDGGPQVGRSARFLASLHGLPLVLRETALEVAPGERLRCAVSWGLFHYEETFALATLSTDPPRTRVSLRVSTESQLPVVGGSLDRFDVRRLAAELSDAALAALRTWCESQDSAPAGPPRAAAAMAAPPARPPQR